MSPIFLDRSRKGPDPYLDWKVRFFFVGALVGVVGMARETGWLIWVAVGILIAGFFLRFLPAREEDSAGWDEAEDDEGVEEWPVGREGGA